MTESQGLRVSAIITAYNCAKFIGEAIDSVLSQTRPVDELIVVDDGSTDATIECVSQFGEPIIRIVSQTNQGPSAARNRGIQESRGELIAFLDCDDIWLPEKVERQIGYLLSHPHAGMVSSDNWQWNMTPGTWELRKRGPRRHGTTSSDILVSNIVGNPSAVLVWRQVFDQSGYFNETMRWGEDWELWIRIARQVEIGFIPEALSIYRSHGGTLSRTGLQSGLHNMAVIAAQAIEAHHPAWQRPILRMRSKSMLQLMRCWVIPAQPGNRKKLFWSTFKATLFYPFENFNEKLKLLILALLGKKLYNCIKQTLVKSASRIPKTTTELPPTQLPISGIKPHSHLSPEADD